MPTLAAPNENEEGTARIVHFTKFLQLKPYFKPVRCEFTKIDSSGNETRKRTQLFTTGT